MRDTEPMPTVTPQAAAPKTSPFFSRLPSFRTPKLRLPRIPLRSAVTGLALMCAVLFVAWTHAEFASLRAEVRDARLAAETATRAADRATLAARATQTALASNDSSTDASNAGTSDTSNDPSQTTDTPQTTETDSP